MTDDSMGICREAFSGQCAGKIALNKMLESCLIPEVMSRGMESHACPLVKWNIMESQWKPNCQNISRLTTISNDSLHDIP